MSNYSNHITIILDRDGRGPLIVLQKRGNGLKPPWPINVWLLPCGHMKSWNSYFGGTGPSSYSWGCSCHS